MQDENENQLSTFIRAFSRKELIEEVEQLVSQTASGTISLCLPKKGDEENMHLFVIPGKKLSGPEEISLTAAIMGKLGHDNTIGGAEIIVRFAPMFNINIYPHTIFLTKDNFENKSLGDFLDTHYPQFFTSPQGNRKASSNENTPGKAKLEATLANVEDFLQGATAEEVQLFSKLCSEKIQSTLSCQKLNKL